MQGQLHPIRTYNWGAGGGSYTVVGGQVQFSGPSMGPSAWGPAEIGDGVLIFRTENGGTSEWKLESRAPKPCNPKIPRYRQPGCVPSE